MTTRPALSPITRRPTQVNMTKAKTLDEHLEAARTKLVSAMKRGRGLVVHLANACPPLRSRFAAAVGAVAAAWLETTRRLPYRMGETRRGTSVCDAVGRFCGPPDTLPWDSFDAGFLCMRGKDGFCGWLLVHLRGDLRSHHHKPDGPQKVARS